MDDGLKFNRVQYEAPVRILDHEPIRPHFLHSSDVIVLSADPRVSEWKARSDSGIRGQIFRGTR